MSKFLQFLAIHFITWGIVAVLGSLVASMYYVEYKDPAADRGTVVMDIRPNAPGSDHAVWAEHKDHCWRFEAQGVATGALLRIHPNDPFIYTTDAALIERAIDQAVNDNPRGLDRVLAFCTDEEKRR